MLRACVRACAHVCGSKTLRSANRAAAMIRAAKRFGVRGHQPDCECDPSTFASVPMQVPTNMPQRNSNNDVFAKRSTIVEYWYIIYISYCLIKAVT